MSDDIIARLVFPSATFAASKNTPRGSGNRIRHRRLLELPQVASRPPPFTTVLLVDELRFNSTWSWPCFRQTLAVLDMTAHELVAGPVAAAAFAEPLKANSDTPPTSTNAMPPGGQEGGKPVPVSAPTDRGATPTNRAGTDKTTSWPRSATPKRRSPGRNSYTQ
jgi:hypothetical protein